ncbi:hypothetical protein PAXRUDRAFT_492103 [Paxillus rubicundulus Ve08.2h10]|uniref:Uncharacterized protein n=1 Tax=Paxillus rubicundulus Ve08.2h10 TaxID=930991 RepID=A0A0D0E133_9AGAM|nr:hypothetical protein PAXRUDRAFT_492103 [Paxillus rubicundulus Ve08.2h10]
MECRDRRADQSPRFGGVRLVLTADFPFSPDGKRVAFGSYNHMIHVVVCDDGTLTLAPILCRDKVRVVQYSANGAKLVAAARTLCIFDADSGNPIFTDRGGMEDWLALVWTGDGSQPIAAKRATVVIHDVASGERVRTWDAAAYCYWPISPHINSLALSPNGKYLAIQMAISETKLVTIADVATGQSVASFRHEKSARQPTLRGAH